MNNQLTKLENGKIIKKENITEEQLINKLYQYERLGTVGKIKSKFEELEVNDDIWHSQFAMARAEEEYLKIQLDDYKTRYENIKREFDASVRFREINQGLKEECRKYKLQLAEKEKEIEEVRSNHANLVADIAYKAVNVYTAESKETGVPTFYKIHYTDLLEIESMDNLRNYAKDKLDFAIAELEKVNELLSINYIISGWIPEVALKEKIDNQIKQLKETK